MNQAHFRRLARLEKRAQAYIERRRRVNVQMLEPFREFAFITIANLVLIVLYGNPKMDEPLLYAWDRVRKSAAWQVCRKEHPDFGEYGHEDQGDLDFVEYGRENRNGPGIEFFDQSAEMCIATPFHRLGAGYIAKYFRKYLLPELFGADETAKLDAVFRKAPPWLVWFCFGDVHGRALGLEPPDLSSVNRFARGDFIIGKLPVGPFECHRLSDHKEYTEFEDDKTARMTRRERKRTRKIMKNFG